VAEPIEVELRTEIPGYTDHQGKLGSRINLNVGDSLIVRRFADVVEFVLPDIGGVKMVAAQSTANAQVVWINPSHLPLWAVMSLKFRFRIPRRVRYFFINTPDSKQAYKSGYGIPPGTYEVGRLASGYYFDDRNQLFVVVKIAPDQSVLALVSEIPGIESHIILHD
jgi:hypothetical protein